MLILGRKYKFTQLEIDRLNKRFMNITTIRYTNKSQESVLTELENVLQQNKFNLLVLNTKAKIGDKIIKYLTNLQFSKKTNKIRIITIEQFMEEFLQKCYIPDDHTDLDFLADIKPFNIFEYSIKRVIDYSAVLVLLCIAWPIMIIARYKIKRQSPGTSMFKQSRVGQNNKEFTCLKFRSMHLNSYHNPYTTTNDHRVFKWGAFMRKTRIDELPQLVNVLRGDMHLIGPRAEWNILVHKYENKIPYYSERHLVKPGITGWAQVMYPYGSNSEDAKQKLMYDLYYIKYWNILLECKVIWRTILVIIKKKGI